MSKAVAIRLCSRQGTKYAMVSKEDAERVKQHRWQIVGKGYAGTRLPGDKSYTYLHRFILGLSQDSYLRVDHIDGVRLRCVRENLRITDAAGNAQNRGSQKNSTSRYRGVHWSKASAKWVAHVQVRGKKSHLGYFSDEKAAARAASAFRAKHMPFSADARGEYII